MSKINKSLLAGIQQAIAKEPRQFDMTDWDCQTSACIAGWALRLSNETITQTDVFQRPKDYETRGAELLRLDESQAARLFFYDQWPLPFCDEYAVFEEDPSARAQVAVERIGVFMKSDGAL